MPNKAYKKINEVLEFNNPREYTFTTLEQKDVNLLNIISGKNISDTKGIYLSPGSNNNTLKNCNVKSFNDGIYLNSASYNIISNISNYDNEESGLYLENSNHNSISNTSNYNNSDGIYLDNHTYK